MVLIYNSLPYILPLKGTPQNCNRIWRRFCLERNIWCLPSWPNTKISFQSFYCFRQMSWKPPLRGAFMVYVARWTSEKRNKISLIGIASIQIKKNLHLTYRLTWISSPSSQDLLWGRPQTNLLTEGTMFWSLSSQDHPHRCSIAPSKVLYIEFLASLRPTAHNQGRQSSAWNTEYRWHLDILCLHS